jgi:hypothetical protein
MTTVPLWIQWRRKYLRPIYGPIYDKSIIEFYRISYKREAKNVARELNKLLKTKRELKISLVYNHEFHPPTYGDFCMVVMIARFLSISGHKINLVINDSKRGGAVWQALRINEQDLFVMNEISLARKLLNDDCNIILLNGDNAMPASNNEIEADIQIDSKYFINWCPHLIHLLIEKYKWQIPNGFLLKGVESPTSDCYITWNIRKSIWATHRDTSEESILQDFTELRNIFPSYSIVILSNQAGLNFAFKALFGVETPEIIFRDKIRIIPQPHDGFEGGIDTILNSSFYFQRNGGGMAIIPIFSEIPFLIFPIEKTNFLGHKKNKIAPWSSSKQIFKKVPLKKPPKKIVNFINL